MDITIRLENENDWQEVELLTREAFWKSERMEKDIIGCNEHYLVHVLRKSRDFISELDFVAEIDGKLVGNIMYSKSYVLMKDGVHHETITFGPLSVLPEFQNKGVGHALMRHSLRVATELGYGAVLIFGHPTYYPRFGFKEAACFNITTESGSNFPAFMAMELNSGDLEGVTGKFNISPLFDINPKDAIDYDQLFPKK